MKKLFCSLATVTLAAACGGGEIPQTLEVDQTGTERRREAWSSGDNPALFGADLEFNLDALPLKGEAAVIPWAGNYWPTYEDNINHRWDGEATDSPAMKYQKAFGGTNVEDAVSKYHGIDSATSAKACAQTSECKSDLGETCAMRRGATKGKCIQTWWGICHAWSPAAILVPEPKRPITRNGVTFKIQDLKALGTLVHNSTTTKFVSLRCNKDNDAKPSSAIAFDNYGRPTDANKECRDTNPGTYHVLLGNYLGIKRQSFVEDRTFDDEVWNQPLRGYRITQKRELTLAEANNLVGASVTGATTVTKTGTVARGAWVRHGSFAVVAGDQVKVSMTGSGDADLYVRLGAEPTATAYSCRPYQDGSNEECDVTVPAGTTSVFVDVQGYGETSTFSVAITTGGKPATGYAFNAQAKRFVHISSEVDYITESSASADGNLGSQISRYTRTDRYEYVLELDATGKIIGGEWVGSSKKNHPDFVWLPTGVSGSSVAGGAITYAQVKSMLDESVTDPNAADKVVQETGVIEATKLKVFGPYPVAAGASLKAELTGTGNVDLYTRLTVAPTVTAYDCRSNRADSVETCSAAGPSSVFVAVQGVAPTSNFKLVVTYR